MAEHTVLRYSGLHVWFPRVPATPRRGAAGSRVPGLAHGFRRRDPREAALAGAADAVARNESELPFRRRFALQDGARQCAHGGAANAAALRNAPAAPSVDMAKGAMSAAGAEAQASWASTRERGTLFAMRLMFVALRRCARPVMLPVVHVVTCYFFLFGRGARK